MNTPLSGKGLASTAERTHGKGWSPASTLTQCVPVPEPKYPRAGLLTPPLTYVKADYSSVDHRDLRGLNVPDSDLTTIISLEGNIGGGKSTVMEFVAPWAEAERVGLCPEPVKLWEETGLLANHYEGKLASLGTQCTFAATQHDALMSVLDGRRQGFIPASVLAERFTDCTRDVFGAMLVTDEPSKQALDIHVAALENARPSHRRAKIWLHVTTDTLMQRVRQRGRSSEQTGVNRGLLQELDRRYGEAHQRWIAWHGADVYSLPGELPPQQVSLAVWTLVRWLSAQPGDSVLHPLTDGRDQYGRVKVVGFEPNTKLAEGDERGKPPEQRALPKSALQESGLQCRAAALELALAGEGTPRTCPQTAHAAAGVPSAQAAAWVAGKQRLSDARTSPWPLKMVAKRQRKITAEAGQAANPFYPVLTPSSPQPEPMEASPSEGANPI